MTTASTNRWHGKTGNTGHALLRGVAAALVCGLASAGLIAGAIAADTPIVFVASERSSTLPASNEPTPRKREAGTDKPVAGAATAERKTPSRPAPVPTNRRPSQLKVDLKQAARAADEPKPAAVNNDLLSVAPVPELPQHLKRNLYGPATPQGIEMGDRPPGSTSLCGDGTRRRFAELDPRTAAAMLPELPAMRPRTICARRGTVIADYVFR